MREQSVRIMARAVSLLQGDTVLSYSCLAAWQTEREPEMEGGVYPSRALALQEPLPLSQSRPLS